MIFKNKKTQKFISILLVVVILLPSLFILSMPKKAEALTDAPAFGQRITTFFQKLFSNVKDTTNTASNVKDTAISVKNVLKEIARQALMTIARKALQEITKSTVNWINSGFHGSPLFLENPSSFLKDIAKSEVKTMVDMFGYDSLKYPFGKNFALNTINSYKRGLEKNASYSLSGAMTEPELRNYRNNFNVGGWNAFLINTQYPQNNYIGFQMIATEELARRVQGTVQTGVQKVKETLAQGAGFLSPETCADNNGNNEYNKVMANAWNRPSFDEAGYRRDHPYDPANRTQWTIDLAKARAEWATKNTCKNLVATTPGSVVSSQIMEAMTSGQDLTELQSALGGSLSAVFDALLNKFIGDGLSSLATKSNSAPTEDNWRYEGQDLDSSIESENGSTWDTWPDEEITLKDFKILLDGKTTWTATGGEIIKESGKEDRAATAGEIVIYVGNTTATTGGTFTPGGILNTETEIKLMDNIDADDLGIKQLFVLIWQKTKELDACLPGPDLGWQDRLTKEISKSTLKIQELEGEITKTGEATPAATAASRALDELSLAINSFKEWVIGSMENSLTNAPTYIDAISDLPSIYQQSMELTDKKKVKTSVLVRLRAFKTEMDAIPANPTPGSAEEKVAISALINLIKKYKPIEVDVSNATTIGDTQNELNITKDKVNSLNDFIVNCAGRTATATTPAIVGERKEKGWTDPSGGQTEQDIFCVNPIKTYFEKVKNTTTNSTVKNAITKAMPGQLTCSVIYKASDLDYKGDLPGKITETDYAAPPVVGEGKCYVPQKATIFFYSTLAECIADALESTSNSKNYKWVKN